MAGHIKKMLLAGGMTLAILLQVSLVGAAPDTTVEVGSAALAPGGSATLPVTVRGIPASSGGLAAYQLDVAFDPRVLQVESASGGDGPFGQLAGVNIDNTAGLVIVTNFVAATSYPVGDIVVARLGLKAVGAAGQTTALDFTSVELYQAEGNPIPASGVGGVVSISGAAAGAEFYASPLRGDTPLAVQFADLSSGSPTAWQWDFGDGAGSNDQNPDHVYQAPGVYAVSLTVTGATGQGSQTKQDYITVSASPTPLPPPTAMPTTAPAATPTAQATGLPPTPTAVIDITPTEMSDALVLAGGFPAWPQLLLAAGGLGLALLGMGLYLAWRARRL